MQERKRLSGGRIAARAGVALGLVAAGLVATATPAFAVVDTLTLSTSHGPTGGGYSIQVTPGVSTTFDVGNGPFTAQFQFGACDNTAGALPQTPVVSTTGAVSAGVVTATNSAATSPATDLVVDVPPALTLPSDVTSGAFSVCIYSSSALLAASSTGAFKVLPLLTPTPNSGAPGGGYSIDVNAERPVFTAYSTSAQSVQFQAKTATQPLCAAAPMGATSPSSAAGTPNTLAGGVIPVPSAGLQATSTTHLSITVPTTLTQPASPMLMRADYNICAYNNSSALIAETSPSSTGPTTFNVNGNVAPSASSGSTAGGNSLTLTGTGTIFTSGATYAQLQSAASNHLDCDSTYATTGSPVNAAQTRYISPSKVAVTLPTTIASGTYNVCVYDATTSSHLVAQAYGYYTVGTVPAILTVTPATGPAQGGSTITVTGTNFPTTPGAMTASIGGVALTNVVVAGGGGSFTAVTPPHAPGNNQSISVTTSGGTVEAKNMFTFTNGITIAPVTAPNSKMTSTDLDVTGVGFTDLTFAPAGTVDPSSAKAHVYLVKGAYDPKPGAPATAKTNGQVAECVDVLVISDTNLICSLYTGGNGPLATSAGRLMTGCTAATSASTTMVPGATNTNCLFYPTDVGMTIAGAGIPAGTTITAVNAANGNATLSRPITAAVTASTPLSTFATTTKALTDAAGTSGTKVLSTTTAMFAATDVGRTVYGTGIPAGTVITEFTDTKNVKISNSLTAGITAGASATAPVFVAGSGPVPNGTYTVTVVSNGTLNAAAASTTTTNAPPYIQSIISSGSTFTVADYLN
ncbi:IPT/TIG domain-containing protein [Dactylosporangium sp. CA-092794]|uniref:IPT/TIG domain-containing protein n=1 Tax=Dactylosporangium sp. CA-092794 TaxID=3239929 RepID=UPI003D906241